MVEIMKPVQALTGISGQYGVSTELLVKAFADIKDADVFRRPDGGNSLHWIAGHVADSRMYIGGLVGLGTKSLWGKLFDAKCEIKEPEAYPTIKEILSAYKDLGVKLLTRFGELSEDELAASIEPNFPGQEKTVFGAIAFLSFHESYHVGQLAYVRRLLGYGPLTG